MNIWICLLWAALIIIVILLVKLHLLRKAAQEIRVAVCEKLKEETNTLIDISSHDAQMRLLADCLNQQLKELNARRRRYEQGDLELKEAILNASHDLRTPLTAISGYLQLLKQEECSENAGDYLAIIENRTAALRSLTEELFRYTIAVSDAEALTLEEVSINSALEASIASYYGALSQKGITPKISLPEKSVMRTLNKDALSRIFGNIISNAIKYSDGDLRVTLTEAGEAIFTNHASAMTETQVGKLFNRFYTVNTARHSTGLGLSIAKALTERMGGTVTANCKDNLLSIHVIFPD
ncbi:MAG: sensor histidine kinase [[Clostridium] scindens]